MCVARGIVISIACCCRENCSKLCLCHRAVRVLRRADSGMTAFELEILCVCKQRRRERGRGKRRRGKESDKERKGREKEKKREKEREKNSRVKKFTTKKFKKTSHHQVVAAVAAAVVVVVAGPSNQVRPKQSAPVLAAHLGRLCLAADSGSHPALLPSASYEWLAVAPAHLPRSSRPSARKFLISDCRKEEECFASSYLCYTGCR